MTPEKLFHELLGLRLNWEVVESRFDQKSGTVFLEIRETAQLWESVHCPKDTGTVTCYDHTEVLTWRHLNVFQHLIFTRKMTVHQQETQQCALYGWGLGTRGWGVVKREDRPGVSEAFQRAGVGAGHGCAHSPGGGCFSVRAGLSSWQGRAGRSPGRAS